VKRRHCLVIVLISAVLVLEGAAQADIYTFTDENGVVHFTNIKPSSKKKFKVYLETPEKRKAKKGVVPIPAKDKSPERYHRYDAHIEEASKLYKIPEPLVRAVIRVESDYDPNVVSVCGAQGLMQLMPGTADRMGVEKPFDPRQNILGGTRYLRILANMFEGDVILTIAGYHAGEGNVVKYGGVPPFKTTVGYVKKVLKYYVQYAASV
jgi:soluble lytic murein transglycosylase-like protein